MGTDYMVVSRTHTIAFAEEADVYIKWAWRNIDWEPVLEFLEIHLDLLTTTSINYWAECQVVDMRDKIQQLVDGDPRLLWDENGRAEAEPLRPAAAELLVHFNFYVENNARILVF